MNRSSLMTPMSTAVLVVAILTGARFSGVNYAQGQDHSRHCAPAQQPVASSISQPPQQNPKPYGRPEQKAIAPKTSDPADATLKMIYSQHLPSLQNAILSVIGQIESGNSQAALAELRRVQSSLDALQKTIERQVKPPFVNAQCPIMGTPVQAMNVPLGLTRSFEGQRVAFCCTGCPGVWDRLPYTEKAAKLTAATGKPKQE